MKCTGYEVWLFDEDGDEFFEGAYSPTETGLERACAYAREFAEEGCKGVETVRVYGVGHRRNGIRPMELLYEIPCN